MKPYDHTAKTANQWTFPHEEANGGYLIWPYIYAC